MYYLIVLFRSNRTVSKRIDDRQIVSIATFPIIRHAPQYFLIKIFFLFHSIFIIPYVWQISLSELLIADSFNVFHLVFNHSSDQSVVVGVGQVAN